MKGEATGRAGQGGGRARGAGQVGEDLGEEDKGSDRIVQSSPAKTVVNSPEQTAR